MSHIRISSVKFINFKALKNYSVSLSETNILVGPNNAGKSTIISAFRILDVAIKRAKRMKAERVPLPNGSTGLGQRVPEQLISVSLENVATDYNGEDSRIEFRLTNKNKLILYFPHDGGCILHWENEGQGISTPGRFKTAFPINIQVVPVLGPLEHNETFVAEETVKSSLNTHRACRHFRNYWHYFDEGWESFSDMIKTTWPDMLIKKPELNTRDKTLSMFVSEKRIDREIYWAGFGFQIWCQLLTHLSRTNETSLVVIDEPEIYLHPDVQRQLLNILRTLNSDVLLATHSVEIMGEADPAEILLVNKEGRSAKRLKDIEGVQEAIETLGSTQNVTLTHLARTKKILFVEGMNDYKTIRRFAKKLDLHDLASGTDLTAFESGGFSSWEKIKSFSWGLKNTIDAKIKIFAVYDRDYYCKAQIQEISSDLERELTYAHVHERKEMENYLLLPLVLDRVLEKQIAAKNRRTEEKIVKDKSISIYLEEITKELKIDAQAQYIAKRLNYKNSPNIDASTLSKETIEEFEKLWETLETRMCITPGKTTLHALRKVVQEKYGVNLTDVKIIDEFKKNEIPEDIKQLIIKLEKFRVS